jgi:CheY-like chemotaxis protein
VRELLRSTLEGHGYRVMAAASGEQALERASVHKMREVLDASRPVSG